MRNNILFPQVYGHIDGPCSERCAHLVCKLKRDQGNRETCGICLEFIGFGRSIYYSGNGGHNPMHADCLHKELAEQIEILTIQEAETAEQMRCNNRKALAIQYFLDGKIENDTYNRLKLGPHIHSSECRVVRLQNPMAHIEEARKAEGVRRPVTGFKKAKGRVVAKPEQADDPEQAAE